MSRPAAAFALLAVLGLAACVEQVPPGTRNGRIIAVSPVDQPGKDTGAGAVVGMVAGGVAGGQFGEGAGKALAVAGGVIAGGIAGSAAESAAQTHDGAAYTVQLDNGQVLTIIQHLDSGEPPLRAGAPVTVETSGSDQFVVPRN